jgi:hypothetical protein
MSQNWKNLKSDQKTLNKESYSQQKKQSRLGRHFQAQIPLKNVNT